MPRVQVVFYRDDNGSVPFLEWFDQLSEKAQDKCGVKIERLGELGYELRRPEADYLRDGIYELRVRLRSVNYRMLYFFHGREVVVLSHGIVKERLVPPDEIELALKRKLRFETDPERHMHEER
ncbi:MAG TPA: type II toxin-antitoxin system RelE/ParE family toxin [Candidatus Anammoximicrobium sp.]|nr:type II toxin-antitoxin system RelE/ParE family toxin [Candidatus Anammoximicrobium sp.]